MPDTVLSGPCRRDNVIRMYETQTSGADKIFFAKESLRASNFGRRWGASDKALSWRSEALLFTMLNCQPLSAYMQGPLLPAIVIYEDLWGFIMIYHDLSWFLMIYHDLSWFCVFSGEYCVVRFRQVSGWFDKNIWPKYMSYMSYLASVSFIDFDLSSFIFIYLHPHIVPLCCYLQCCSLATIKPRRPQPSTYLVMSTMCTSLSLCYRFQNTVIQVLQLLK